MYFFPQEIGETDSECKSPELSVEVQPVAIVSQFIAEFSELSQTHTLAAENQKLQRMKRVLQILQAEFPEPHLKNQTADALAAEKSFWAIFFWPVVFLNFVPQVIGGFLGIQEICLYIPSLSLFWTNVISLIMCVVETLLYYAMFTPLFQRAFGIPITESHNPLAACLAEQMLVLTQLVHHLKFSASKMKEETFEEYHDAVQIFIDKLTETSLPEYQESKFMRLLRLGLSCVNQILTLSGVYFMATSLLEAMAPILIGSVIGWSIIGIMIFGQVLGQLLLRSDSMFYMMNPEAVKYDEVKAQLADFKAFTEPTMRREVALIAYQIDLKSENAKRTTQTEILSAKLSDHKVKWHFFQKWRSNMANQTGQARLANTVPSTSSTLSHC